MHQCQSKPDGLRATEPDGLLIPYILYNYVRHTTIGDPELDTMMEELSSMPIADLHRFIGAGIEQRDEILRDAPQIMRDFFDSLEEPSWLNQDDFQPGIRAFHANVDLMLIAFATGVLVEGF